MPVPTSIGRFAPSPSGPLHFGSLVSALASFLDARKREGQWLVRIEDIDPPREVPGASDQILKQLEDHGLCWDAEVLYQSSRLDSYRDCVEHLLNEGLAYHCQCNRQRLNNLSGIYDGHCRDLELNSSDHSARLRIDKRPSDIKFDDQIMGHYQQCVKSSVGDFVVQRRDRLFSYQLAVVLDDEYQGISHVMRGTDLLDSTPRQIYLQQCLGYRQPVYAHVPLALNSEGQKLSKQNLATGLHQGLESQNLHQALHWLQQAPPKELADQSVVEILRWATDHWSLEPLASNPTNAPAPAGC